MLSCSTQHKSKPAGSSSSLTSTRATTSRPSLLRPLESPSRAAYRPHCRCRLPSPRRDHPRLIPGAHMLTTTARPPAPVYRHWAYNAAALQHPLTAPLRRRPSRLGTKPSLPPTHAAYAAPLRGRECTYGRASSIQQPENRQRKDIEPLSSSTVLLNDTKKDRLLVAAHMY